MLTSSLLVSAPPRGRLDPPSPLLVSTKTSPSLASAPVVDAEAWSWSSNCAPAPIKASPVSALFDPSAVLSSMKALLPERVNSEEAAIVLICAGKTFIAGADISEFGKAPKGASLFDVQNAMENSPKPVIAAIHGTALGGGLEVALTCHYRVAVPSARCGLPEVNLGLLPGAGGTQRLPRAVGPELAVKMIVGGDPISASDALKNGLIEEIVEGPAAGGEAFARKVLAEKRPLRKLRDDDSKLAAAKADRSIFTNAVAAMTKKARGLEAPGNGSSIETLEDDAIADGFDLLYRGIRARVVRYP